MAAQAARRREAQWWEQAGVVPGARVADVGCGPGAVLAVLSELVGPSGSVVGVDADADAVAAARAMVRAGSIGNASVVQAGADATGLLAASFDVVMTLLMLAHVGGQEQRIVDHLAGLVRPGGTVYLVDVDVTAIRIYPPLPSDLAELWNRYVQFHRRMGNDPQVGLPLQHLLVGAGLEPID